MSKKALREIPVTGGLVECGSGKRESIDKCRFCVHSKEFLTPGGWVPSPARAYCTMTRATNQVDLKKVTAVRCDDDKKEGFRSIMNIIG